MSIEKIERELRAALEGVTPGPWRMHVPDRGYCYNYLLTDAPEFAPIEGKYPWRHLIADFDDCARGEINAAFIARCSPENIRALLDELSRLRTALHDIRDAANSFQDEEGYEVAAQIRIRVDAALSEREGQDG